MYSVQLKIFTFLQKCSLFLLKVFRIYQGKETNAFGSIKKFYFPYFNQDKEKSAFGSIKDFSFLTSIKIKIGVDVVQLEIFTFLTPIKNLLLAGIGT